MPLISEYWLCIPLFCQIHLLGRVIFLVESIGFSMYTIISSANSDSFTFFFPVWMPVISLSYMITGARTSNTILNRSGESGPPCLVPDLSWKAFTSFYPLSVILACSFLSLLCLYLVWGLGWCWLHKKSLGVPSSWNFWNSLRRIGVSSSLNVL